MELKDFVTETLSQIIEGIKNAQIFADKSNAKINPKELYPLNFSTSGAYADSKKERLAQFMEFDIAVTASKGSSGKAGVGVFTGVLGIGGQTQSETSNQTVNRIKFSVPIFLPQH